MRFSPSCRCCHCNWTVTVRGGCSNENLSGLSVAAKQSGVTIASGTTNASGVVVLDVPAGTYDLVVGAGSGYAASTTSGVVHTCGQTTTVTLSADADHFCGACCPGTTPTSLALTVSSSTFAGADDTLSYASAIPGVNWQGPWHDRTDGDPGSYRYNMTCDVGNLSLLVSFSTGPGGTGIITNTGGGSGLRTCNPLHASGLSAIITWTADG